MQCWSAKLFSLVVMVLMCTNLDSKHLSTIYTLQLLPWQYGCFLHLCACCVTTASSSSSISCWHSAKECPLLCIYSLPAYSAVDCGDPGTPTNGQHSDTRTTFSYAVFYTCDVGYTLQGSNSRTCQSNGQWSGSVPQCNGMLINKQEGLNFYHKLLSVNELAVVHEQDWSIPAVHEKWVRRLVLIS